MAKGAYIGAPLTDVMTSNNVGSWFTLSDPDGISSWNGTTLTVTGTYSNERVKLTALRDMTVSFDYTTDSFCKISFKGQYICDEGDDGHYTATLEAGKYFYFSNSSAVSSQTCTFTNITCTSATSVAHKIKKGYIGVDGKARKIKKAYIGVGSVARLCWSSVGTLSYYGKAANANSATYYGHGASNSKYAVFGGGQPNGSTSLATNTAYNADLTKVSCPDCSNAGGNKFAIGNSQYVFIPTKGGKIDTFNTSLTRKTITGWTWEESPATGVLNKSDRVVYASGTAVRVFDSNLTLKTVSASTIGTYVTGTSVDGGVVFGGGMTSTNTYGSTMYGINETLTVTSVTALTGNNRRFTGTLNGCGIIAGGGEGSKKKADSYCYDKNFTQTKLTNLPAIRSFGASASLENYFLILGGEVGNASGTSGTSNTVLSYDNNFTQSNATSLSRVFAGGAAAVIGNSALVWGGFSSTSWSWSSGPVTNTVDVYQEI